MTARVRKTTDGYSFKCPGCGDHHHVRTEGPRALWAFNGNVESPTFSPSLLMTAGHYCYPDREKAKRDGCWCNFPERFPDLAKRYAHDGTKLPCCYVCHSFVTDGHIQFLGDCTHALAGKMVPLTEVTP